MMSLPFQPVLSVGTGDILGVGKPVDILPGMQDMWVVQDKSSLLFVQDMHSELCLQHT
jgi:hypothetical protein